jgi:hypothetical protein
VLLFDKEVIGRLFSVLAQYSLPQLPQVKYVWVSVQSRICELIPAWSLTYSQEKTVVTDVGPLSCCKLRPANSFRTFSFYALLGPIYWSFLLNVCRCSWPSYCAYYACWRWHQHLRLLYVTLRKPIALADKLALGGGLFYMPQLVSVPIFREFRLTPFFLAVGPKFVVQIKHSRVIEPLMQLWVLVPSSQNYFAHHTIQNRLWSYCFDWMGLLSVFLLCGR